MNSFGFWYDDAKSNASLTSELHINVWDVNKKVRKKSSTKDAQKTSIPFIDIGLRISNYSSCKGITIAVPFLFDKNDCIDLSSKILDETTAYLLFNSDVEVSKAINTTGNKMSLTVAGQPMDLCAEKPNIETDDENKYTLINICFAPDHNNRDLYLRYRIQSKALENALFCKIKKKNKYLESAFTGVKLIDMKVNETRNIPQKINSRFSNQDKISFSQIHLFIMEPVDNEVILTEALKDCRVLETSWSHYLSGTNADIGQNQILAYHWKYKSNDADKQVEKINQLVKVSYSATNIWLILVYILIVIVLGIFTNLLYDALPCIFTNLINLIRLIQRLFTV